jgi:antitoxin (DNA-binding transcriptional repressor) of toxin-antitoxin stability system
MKRGSSEIRPMRAIDVSELKAHLSRYLRMASKGARILVKDGDEALAQLTPPDAPPQGWRERMAREGRLRLGSQDWDQIQVSPLKGATDIQIAPGADLGAEVGVGRGEGAGAR